MPVSCVCCGKKCLSPTAYLITPTGLTLCCGILDLDDINDVTFVVFPGSNIYIGAARDYLATTAYDGANNCDVSAPVDSVLVIDYRPSYMSLPPSILEFDNYLNDGPPGANLFHGPAGPNGHAIASHDGMIFGWDESLPGPSNPTLPVGTITVPNNENDPANGLSQACDFPDPFTDNPIASGGSATIVPVCTNVTITSIILNGVSVSSGASVSNAAGTGSVTFTAVDDVGGDGDWYATKLATISPGIMAVIFGTGIYVDALVFTSPSTGNGADTITFTFAANASGADRDFGVVINGDSFTFTQTA
jgi:hypothetical protein